ncbi:MAG: hypothetical protein JJU21_05940 [Salinarimonas sp.]|nr:hypothetical protein [Salinarimonas sp.]
MYRRKAVPDAHGALLLRSLGAQPVREHRIALLKVFRAGRFILLVGCRFSNFLAAAFLALGHDHSPSYVRPWRGYCAIAVVEAADGRRRRWLAAFRFVMILENRAALRFCFALRRSIGGAVAACIAGFPDAVVSHLRELRELQK